MNANLRELVLVFYCLDRQGLVSFQVELSVDCNTNAMQNLNKRFPFQNSSTNISWMILYPIISPLYLLSKTIIIKLEKHSVEINVAKVLVAREKR